MCLLVTLAAARGNVACLRLVVALVLAGDDNLREIDDDHIASLLADISSHKVRVARLSARINWLFEISAYPVSAGTGTAESSA
jgi:hypothetical protein